MQCNHKVPAALLTILEARISDSDVTLVVGDPTGWYNLTICRVNNNV